MEKRPLGRSGITVGPWCVGGNVFGATADEKLSFDLLDAVDTAGLRLGPVSPNPPRP